VIQCLPLKEVGEKGRMSKNRRLSAIGAEVEKIGSMHGQENEKWRTFEGTENAK